MRNSSGNAGKESMKTDKNDETGKILDHVGTKGNSNTRKNNKTWENKSESTGKRRKIKKTSRKGKTILIKQDIPKQQKKILPTSRRRWHEDIPITGCKGS